ncbi:hypothetical protein EYM_01000 [Ignicoccus islandicus DSM 13165]|uniref:Uncharacterized protein n=1 Tax=Ignicoccus islandicus DSM 13165 TaxID=940295 RepID=A0A0U3FJU3_9CREN|nr:hypothetical protein EYM_01000 [Ignicoccus islandicus DSM 13165]
MLVQAREHIDRYGSLDSEGRTLVSKAIRLLKSEGLRVNWRDLRKQWDVEKLDKLIGRVANVVECLERANRCETRDERECEMECFWDSE